MSPEEQFKCRFDLMKAYGETAKSCIQLSTGALVLPLLFNQAILGRAAADNSALSISWSLRLSWSGFLLSIGFGLLYQWLGIRLIWDELHFMHNPSPGFRGWRILSFGQWNRSILYGAMLGSFFAGALFFVIFAWYRLRK